MRVEAEPVFARGQADDGHPPVAGRELLEGMMPHPERMIEQAHGGTDGRKLFEGLLETVA